MPGRPTQLSRGPYHWPLKRPPGGSASRIRVHSVVKSLRLAKRHGEARIHQLHAERQGHFLQSSEDRRDGAGQLARGELAQRLRLGIDRDDAPAASQNFDDVAPVAAAEIDRQRIGGRFAERVERSQQRAARRSVAQLLVVGGPSGCL